MALACGTLQAWRFGWREMETHRRHQRSVNWRSGEESRLLAASKPHEPRQIIDDGLHFFLFRPSRRKDHLFLVLSVLQIIDVGPRTNAITYVATPHDRGPQQAGMSG